MSVDDRIVYYELRGTVSSARLQDALQGMSVQLHAAVTHCFLPGSAPRNHSNQVRQILNWNDYCIRRAFDDPARPMVK